MVDRVEFWNLDKLICRAVGTYVRTLFCLLVNFVNAHTPVRLIKKVLKWIVLPYKVSMSRECCDIVESRAVNKLLIIIRCVNAYASRKSAISAVNAEYTFWFLLVSLARRSTIAIGTSMI